jgi:hypothetical protein
LKAKRLQAKNSSSPEVAASTIQRLVRSKSQSKRNPDESNLSGNAVAASSASVTTGIQKIFASDMSAHIDVSDVSRKASDGDQLRLALQANVSSQPMVSAPERPVADVQSVSEGISDTCITF